MDTPVVAQYKPYFVDVTEGERYLWCSCGLSKTQPWCDQSHVGTSFKPLRYVAQKSAPVLICGCKHTGAAPFCDGSHNNLVDEYEGDPRPLEELLAATTEVLPDAGGRAMLDGGCYVQLREGLACEQLGDARVAAVISTDAGARFLDQYYLELAPGSTPPLSFEDAEVVLYGLEGEARITIADREYQLPVESGVYVRKGEAFAIGNAGGETVRLLATVCPGGARLKALPAMHAYFDSAVAKRVVARDDSQRNTMADRFYQILVGEDCGCEEISQFLGQIPQSKAAPHHHLYEEAIVILNGEGIMWTEHHRTPVKPGDMIFLPARQQHSLQCTSKEGMLMAGHFYPSGSPAINY